MNKKQVIEYSTTHNEISQRIIEMRSIEEETLLELSTDLLPEFIFPRILFIKEDEIFCFYPEDNNLIIVRSHFTASLQGNVVKIPLFYLILSDDQWREVILEHRERHIEKRKLKMKNKESQKVSNEKEKLVELMKKYPQIVKEHK